MLVSCKGKKEIVQSETNPAPGFPSAVQLSRQLKSQFIDAKKEKILGNTSKAKSLFEQVLNGDPSCTACAYELAEIAIKEQNARVALSMSALAFNAEPNNKFYKEQRAEIIYMLGDAKQAAILSKSLIDSFPTARDHYTRTIFYYEKAALYPEAEVILGLYKQQFGFTYQTAMMYDYLYDMYDNTDGKVGNWEALVAKYPNDIGYRNKYINALIDFAQYTKAENELNMLDEKAETLGQNHLMRAKIYSLQKDWPKYISNLTKAAEDTLLESSIKVQYLVRTEEIKDTAILLPIRLIAQDEPLANDYLVFYQKQFGQKTSALDALLLKYKAHPDDKVIAESLVDAYKTEYKFKEALVISSRLVSNNPSLVEYYLMQAEILLANGEFADAYSYADQGLVYAINDGEMAACFINMAFANFYLGKTINVKEELGKAWELIEKTKVLQLKEKGVYLSLVTGLFELKIKNTQAELKESYMAKVVALYQATNYDRNTWQALDNLSPNNTLIKEAWLLKAKKEGASRDVLMLKNNLIETFPNHAFYKNI